MFSQVSVYPQVRCAWQGGMRGRGHAWQGVCAAGGMHDRVWCCRGCAWQGSMCGRGYVWQGWHALQEGMHGGGMHGRGHV